MDILNFPASEAQEIIALALREDIGTGDVTTQLLIPERLQGRMLLVAREPLVACGISLVDNVFARLDETVRCEPQCHDGQRLASGDVLVVITGAARSLLTGERVALNLLQRMCGVATQTRAYVEAVRGTKAVILDTRKTMPGMRALDKYAVRAGGGQNHRMRLDDMVLIKDNHIVLCGGIAEAVAKARRAVSLPIVVECDTPEQVREALPAAPDRILLDNMSHARLREAVALAEGKIPLEASGGVTLATIREIAQTGVDYISVGALTHSVKASDIGADMLFHNADEM